jgi:hypothetical protein
MRFVLTLVIAVHAALHLIGFAKSLKLAALPQITGKTLVPLSTGSAHAVGYLWLAAAGVFLAAAFLRTLRNDDWWLVAAAGVVLSQGLVVFHWADAKAGTFANVTIGVAVVVAAATTRFKGDLYDDVRSLLAGASRTEPAAVRPADLERLPQPVRRWLVRSGVIGKPPARTVRLIQRGEIRTSPTGAWMPFRAEQYFSVEPPAFLWSADVTMMRTLPIVGRDEYLDGKGHMLIKALSLVSVVDATGKRIDQGTLTRYLAEIVWFPSAALNRRVAWIPLDGTRAKAVMSYGGVTASAVFSFDDLGRFTSMRAERFMGGGADARLRPWVARASEWRRESGVEVPVRGDVAWQLESGAFDYYRWEIAELEVDARTPYASSALFTEVVREPETGGPSALPADALPGSRNDLAPSYPEQ